MGLFLKPHTASVSKVSPVVSGNRILRYERSVVGSVSGQMTEKTSNEIREGFGLETRFPALWLMDLGSAIVLAAGDVLTVAGRTYRVVAPGRVSDAEAVTSHLSVVCERDD